MSNRIQPLLYILNSYGHLLMKFMGIKINAERYIVNYMLCKIHIMK